MISFSGRHYPKFIIVPTLNRDLADLVAQNCLIKTGRGMATAYKVSPVYKVFAPYNSDAYFDLNPDARQSRGNFNQDILELLGETELFTNDKK